MRPIVLWLLVEDMKGEWLCCVMACTVGGQQVWYSCNFLVYGQNACCIASKAVGMPWVHHTANIITR